MPQPDEDFPIHYMKQGDLLPFLEGTLHDGAGNIIDLTNATHVWFNMRNRDGAALITHGTVTVVTAALGLVLYAWVAGDTDLDPDIYLAEFEATFPGSPADKPLRFPNNGDIQVVITQKAA